MKPNRWTSPYLRRVLIAHLCGLTIAVTTAHAQAVNDPASEPTNTTQTPPAKKDAKTATTPKPKETEVTKPEASDKTSDDDAIRMSAFQVTTEKDKGYLGGNAMSGTRLNSDIDDIAASVTVITKQQLMDTAAIDINDIFAYEVSTEGTRTYTANFNDGKSDVDSVALNPETANRVRGIGNANISVGNFGASSSIPIDTYNVDAVEISRGANSSIFGIGEVSGSVNLVPAAANLTREITRVQGSVTSYGSTRETLDVNRPILKNVLALRLNAVNENKGYLRDPSYDRTRRFQLGLTFKPFSKTTIRLSYEKFRETYSRPNSVTPRETMSFWAQNGKPSYDPTTNVWSYTNSAGVVVTGTQPTKTNGDTITNFPAGVMLTGTGSNRVRPTMFIDQGEAQWFGTTYWIVNNNNAAAHELVQLLVPNGYGVPAQYVGTLSYSGVKASTNKQFYDWEKVNLAGLNIAKKNAELIRMELEQYIIKSEHHTLAAQLGFFKENIFDYRRTFVGNGGDGVPLSIQPDVNTKLPDGSPNPHYGAPYIAQLAPQTYSNPIGTKTLRLNLAYQLDMTHEKNIFKWLGKHNLVGYTEDYDKVYSRNSLRYVDQIDTAISPWLNPSIRNSNSAKYNARYYLGDGVGGNVDYASSAPSFDKLITFHRFNQPPATATGTPLSPNAPANVFYNESVPVGTAYFANNLTNVKTKTMGAILQSFLVNDKIVLTYGRRKDTQRTRDNTSPEPASSVDANGLSISQSWMSDFGNSPYLITNKKTGARENSGQTESKGIIVKPFRWINLRYSESNSFKPESYAIDYQGTPLDNPHGTTKDYGIQLNLIDRKLWMRITHFETKSEGARNSGLNAVASRITNFDFDASAGSDGSKVDLQDWVRDALLQKDGYDLANIPAGVSDQYELLADKYIGLDPQRIADMRTFDRVLTSTVESRGYEVELNYNPTKYWTVKVVGSQTKNMISSIGSTWQQYRDERMPIWLSIKNPLTQETYWDHIFSGNNVPSAIWIGQNDAPMKVNLALQGKPSPNTRKYKGNILTTYRLAGLSTNRFVKAFTVGGSIRWEDKATVGFYGGAPDADGLVRTYDINKPIYDPAHTYADIWVRYDFSMWSNRIKGNVQLNVRNVTESGRLQAFAVNPDGTFYNYRIVDPREFVLGVSLDL